MASIWLDSVSFKLDEYIQTAKGMGLFEVSTLLLSFIFFIDTKSILRECYLEIITAWKVSPWVRSLVSKVRGSKEYFYSCLDFRDYYAWLKGVQPRFSPQKENSRKTNNFRTIPGMEESFKKWFVLTDKRNGGKTTMLYDDSIFHRRWLMETVMFYFMTIKRHSPFRDQKRFHRIPKLQDAILQKHKESSICRYAELPLSKFCSDRNNRYGRCNGLMNNLSRISEILKKSGFANTLGRSYHGFRDVKRNGTLTSLYNTSKNVTFPKSLLTQYPGTTNGFFDTGVIDTHEPWLNSLREQDLATNVKYPSSCDILTSCICQFAGNSTLTLIIPSNKTIIYFDPCLQTSKAHQERIVGHLMNTIYQHFPKLGGAWSLLSLKDPRKFFTKEECGILVNAFAEQVLLHRSKSFTINPNLLKQNPVQMAPLSKILGNPLFSWKMF